MECAKLRASLTILSRINYEENGFYVAFRPEGNVHPATLVSRHLSFSDGFEGRGHQLGACRGHWCSPHTVNTTYSVRPLIKHACVLGTTLSLGIKGVLEAVEDLSRPIKIALLRWITALGCKCVCVRMCVWCAYVRVSVRALVREAPFSMFVLKVRVPSPSPSPSPSISWQAIHLLGVS